MRPHTGRTHRDASPGGAWACLALRPRLGLLNYLSVGFMYVIFLSFFDVLLIDYFVVTSLFLSVELAVRLARVRANARYRGGHAVDQVSAVTGTAPAKE